MMDRIGAEWHQYRMQMMPLEAPSVQASECRLAFYAGALTLLRLLTAILEPGAEATEKDLRVMDEIAEEMRAFFLASVKDAEMVMTLPPRRTSAREGERVSR